MQNVSRHAVRLHLFSCADKELTNSLVLDTDWLSNINVRFGLIKRDSENKVTKWPSKFLSLYKSLHTMHTPLQSSGLSEYTKKNLECKLTPTKWAIRKLTPTSVNSEHITKCIISLQNIQKIIHKQQVRRVLVEFHIFESRSEHIFILMLWKAILEQFLRFAISWNIQRTQSAAAFTF